MAADGNSATDTKIDLTAKEIEELISPMAPGDGHLHGMLLELSDVLEVASFLVAHVEKDTHECHATDKLRGVLYRASRRAEVLAAYAHRVERGAPRAG